MGIRVQKKAFALLLRKRTTNAYNYMQSKISVIRAIRVQKKRIYMRYLLGKEQRMSLYFSEHESHGFHEFRHCNAVSIKQLAYQCNHVDK